MKKIKSGVKAGISTYNDMQSAAGTAVRGDSGGPLT